jgi:hypothetical protein
VVVRALAFLALLYVLFVLFRFAMGLRYAKRTRERAKDAEEARGRRVITEVPLSEADVVFLTEDEHSFAWGPNEVRKDAIVGARQLLNGGILQECAREPGALPPPAPPEEFEGRERWEIVLYLRGGGSLRIPCGTLREGVSREIAGRAYRAVREAMGM